MKKKLNIFILFFLLSITPFIRGCGETFGFPFPALNDILQFNSAGNVIAIRETIAAAVDSLNSHETLLFLAVNFLIAYLLAMSVLRDQKHPRWAASFVGSLAINISAVWFMIALMCIEIKQPAIKKAAELYGACFGHYFLDLPIEIAEHLDNIISKAIYPCTIMCRNILESLDLSIIDIMSRAWFITVTILLAIAIYFIKMVKRALFK